MQSIYLVITPSKGMVKKQNLFGPASKSISNTAKPPVRRQTARAFAWPRTTFQSISSHPTKTNRPICIHTTFLSVAPELLVSNQFRFATPTCSLPLVSGWLPLLLAPLFCCPPPLLASLKTPASWRLRGPGAPGRQGVGLEELLEALPVLVQAVRPRVLPGEAHLAARGSGGGDASDAAPAQAGRRDGAAVPSSFFLLLLLLCFFLLDHQDGGRLTCLLLVQPSRQPRKVHRASRKTRSEIQ